jgi:hypothetical protein
VYASICWVVRNFLQHYPKESLPVAFGKKLAYMLPRRSMGIEVWDGRGRKLYTLTWMGDRFRPDRGVGR